MRTILPANKNPVLRKVAREIAVSEIKSKRIQTIIAEMKKLLSKEEFGVALAAPQVGEQIKLFIISGRALLRQAQDKSPRHPKSDYEDSEATPDLSRAVHPERSRGESRDQVYINPELLKLSRSKSSKHEGCLSLRGFWGLVPRAEKGTIRAYDEHGVRFTRGASGFLAHIFQHEMDHLEGILYTDKVAKIYEEKQVEK